MDHLLEEIFEGRLRPHDRIDLFEVAAALGVSRSPVREALVVLERDGIVSIRHHRGAFVEPFDRESIMLDFEVMGLLSGLAVSRVAAKGDPEVIAELARLVQELRDTPLDQLDRLEPIVQQILATEHRAAGSGRLRSVLRSPAGFVPWAFRVKGDRAQAETLRTQERILKAIEAGDAEQASEYRLQDFRAAGERVVRELLRRGVIDPDEASSGAPT